jgi:Leucine-rich repeat (LRR) protein
MKNRVYVLLLLCFFVFIAGGQVPESDSLALVALYDSTNGPGWTASTNWLQTGQPVSTWYGITVLNDSVGEIELADNNLTGVIPPQIGDLGRLNNLDLHTNQLTGPIPSEIGNLDKLLYLNLGENNLTDTIPPEIGDLDRILTIDFQMNELTGPIPSELGSLSNLQSLVLGNNQLTDSIPVEICNLSNLTWLDLKNNQLTGSIPHEIENLTNLQYVYLFSNKLSGPIPVEICYLSNLRTLSIYDNGFTGSIPPEIGNLTNLEYLLLSENELTGPIPHEIGSMTKLKTIYLQYNQLTDSIPPEIGNLSDLINLDLFINQLSGPIPPEIGNLSNLTSLSLNNNHIEGPLPPEICDLSELVYMHLQNNQISGSIPSEISDLSKLRYLRLHHNQLTGSIPAGFGGIPNLTNLLLNNNMLSGPVPEDIKNIPSYCQFDIYKNYFTFYDLEPIAGFSTDYYDYSPQLDVEVSPRRVDRSTGDDLQIDLPDYAVPEVTATNNLYKWWLENDSITPYSASPLLELNGLSDADSGYYRCSMINSDFPELTLYTDVIHLVIDAPVDITLEPDSVDENITPETIVGTLSADDPDQETGHTFTLVDGDGSNDLDNYLFMIDGSDLIIVDSPDYEMKPEFHIYVRATDEDFKTFDKALIVYVRDLFETGFSMDFSADLLVYPNPANGIIHIQLPEGATHCSIELLDMYGKTVYQEKRHAGEELDIGNFPAAVYYIRIIYNNQLVTTKIIKNQ